MNFLQDLVGSIAQTVDESVREVLAEQDKFGFELYEEVGFWQYYKFFFLRSNQYNQASQLAQEVRRLDLGQELRDKCRQDFVKGLAARIADPVAYLQEQETVLSIAKERDTRFSNYFSYLNLVADHGLRVATSLGQEDLTLWAEVHDYAPKGPFQASLLEEGGPIGDALKKFPTDATTGRETLEAVLYIKDMYSRLDFSEKRPLTQVIRLLPPTEVQKMEYGLLTEFAGIVYIIEAGLYPSYYSPENPAKAVETNSVPQWIQEMRDKYGDVLKLDTTNLEELQVLRDVGYTRLQKLNLEELETSIRALRVAKEAGKKEEFIQGMRQVVDTDPSDLRVWAEHIIEHLTTKPIGGSTYREGKI